MEAERRQGVRESPVQAGLGFPYRLASALIGDHVENVGVSKVDEGTAAAWNSLQPRNGFKRKATAAMDTSRQLPTHGDGLLDMGELARTPLESMVSEVTDAQADMQRGDGADARDGYRERGLATPVGDITPRMPEPRAGAYFPEGMIERYSRAEQDEDRSSRRCISPESVLRPAEPAGPEPVESEASRRRGLMTVGTAMELAGTGRRAARCYDADGFWRRPVLERRVTPTFSTLPEGGGRAFFKALLYHYSLRDRPNPGAHSDHFLLHINSAGRKPQARMVARRVRPRLPDGRSRQGEGQAGLLPVLFGEEEAREADKARLTLGPSARKEWERRVGASCL